MHEQELRQLLQHVADRTINVDEAVEALRTLPFETLGFATLDHHRALRVGFPEVVYCAGKTPAQVAEIFARLAARNPRVLGTRATTEHADAVRAVLPDAQYDETARLVWIDRQPDAPRRPGVLVVAAGTSDLPVAEEAARTLELMGHAPHRIYDVGVAGLHRLLAHVPTLRRANVIVVVAGMEGALPSVVAGLVDCPVIAVPTSVGYGANFGGLSALLTMLNSCASGIAVVNIDNGFGAGYMAALINRRCPTPDTHEEHSYDKHDTCA
ncbi:nickel pincer cofactor biosynthesis protein LarB [Ardenticatena maritima]|uniref:1-(5-phosphoribosyl)-5-amino-4-imidazole-carboxylate carboxylase n=2 Tax=Ardenticatena maritima TaxID=872965 RepID=A0A0P6YJF3_9CHLR|nr:nickel pincer cofactor biosynthesis protein LarB [Ardenticatena maritima]KPL89816.1 1-(5-phosphoribosyl)-5-amino-4-imidazole-carboxylate carboxylase [Ardenticatena maritima]